ncbi:hypothetical protein F8M41_024313 [Gigaspora margarita]|uniref:Uncharacterized protein n=1 Tax=Gigaspora margarita TaxID=4874 RepID=A0A8H4B0H1_GIGMA|nr:hypothetical protein F8M41_024313 [Gigaspora margarita]
MKALDDFTPESRKGTKVEVRNKEHKTSIYYQKPASPNQYETCTSGVCSQNGPEVERIVNDMDSQLPELEFDDLVLDLIEDDLVEEPMAEEEKETVQEPSKASGIVKDEDKTFTYCQKSAKVRIVDGTNTARPNYKKECVIQSNRDKRIDVKIDEHEAFDYFSTFTETDNASGCYYIDPIAVAQNNDNELEVEVDCKEQVEAVKNKSKSFEYKLEDRVRVKNNVAESAEVGDINGTSIESQALLYDQFPVKTIEVSHMSGAIEPDFEQRARSEEESLIDYQKTIKMNNVNKTKVDDLNLKKETMTETVPKDPKKLWMISPSRFLIKKTQTDIIILEGMNS